MEKMKIKKCFFCRKKLILGKDMCWHMNYEHTKHYVCDKHKEMMTEEIGWFIFTQHSADVPQHDVKKTKGVFECRFCGKEMVLSRNKIWVGVRDGLKEFHYCHRCNDRLTFELFLFWQACKRGNPTEFPSPFVTTTKLMKKHYA